ncbi:MAG: DAHL domain-containing protein [Pseudomonadota bacterium]
MSARKRLGWLPMPALGLLLASVLLFLYLRTQDYDPSSYFENVALLRQIQQLDVHWELDAMKSKIGINQSYDPLVDSLPDLNVLPRQLKVGSALSGIGDAVLLAGNMAAFQRALRDKTELVESFKSHNAVLRNSLAFLPIAAEEIASLAGTPGSARLAAPNTVLAAVNRVLLATLIYENGASDEQAVEIERQLDTLAAAARRLPGVPDERVALFVAHVRTVLREHRVVNGLLAGIAASPTAMRIDDVNAILAGEHQRAVLHIQRYRLYLLLFAAALIGLLLYAALRLLRSHATINRVNNELTHANGYLETAVRQRTYELLRSNEQLQAEIAERKQLECRLVQSEKLASIGQLAAGVAHEINNPLAFLRSNFSVLEKYIEDLFGMLAAYERAEQSVASEELAAGLKSMRERIEMAYLKQDIPILMTESRSGMLRVGKIVQDLKDFSRVGSAQKWEWADIHRGIDATLNLIAGEIRDAAEVRREYGAVPEIECLPLQLNQVVMSLVLNAAQAMRPGRGQVTIRTGVEGESVWIEVADTGCGIPDDVLPRIFDPFFTTRAIGKGTGLGLSLSYGIVQQHHGRIEVRTVPGGGSTFRVLLPVRHNVATELRAVEGIG